MTLLDHSQENVVLNPVAPAGISAGIGSSSIGAMAIDIPNESLSDFSTVLISLDPISSPLQVDPKIIQEANEKARAAGGLYRVPIAIQEISAYNAQGESDGRSVKTCADHAQLRCRLWCSWNGFRILFGRRRSLCGSWIRRNSLWGQNSGQPKCGWISHGHGALSLLSQFSR